ncbi:MAG TPA: aminodeoxychorismate lyase [Propionibacteriaceae bacterium]|nr:aminodeoxychorismate lyase [Propionibacteriaceae bacterium]
MQVQNSAAPTSAQHLTVWVNGVRYESQSAAKVPATDHGLVVGDGVFEALKVTRAGPFAVQRHLNRLSRSAAAMGLPAPDHAGIRAAIEEVLDGRGFDHGRLRITYTGGIGPLSSSAAYGSPTLVVAAGPEEPPAAFTSIVTAPWTRNERGALSGVKSTSYAENVRTLAYATRRRATEAIFLNTEGNVCEGTGTNIFVVMDGTIVTPPLSSGPLAGITREVIMEWCDVEERDFTLTDAMVAKEVFITSSLRDVQAVHRWDEIDLGTSHPMTDHIAATFAERSSAIIDP